MPACSSNSYSASHCQGLETPTAILFSQSSRLTLHAWYCDCQIKGTRVDGHCSFHMLRALPVHRMKPVSSRKLVYLSFLECGQSSMISLLSSDKVDRKVFLSILRLYLTTLEVSRFNNKLLLICACFKYFANCFQNEATNKLILLTIIISSAREVEETTSQSESIHFGVLPTLCKPPVSSSALDESYRLRSSGAITLD